MKQRLFCLLAVLALLPAVSAQLPYTSVVASDQNYPTGFGPISRSWTSTLIVSYTYQGGGVGHFYLIDVMGGGAIMCELHFNNYVYDFRICNDTVYFCGSNDLYGSQQGFIGWFDINDLLYNSFVDIYINQIDVAAYLSQMLAYYDPVSNSTKVVAIGSDLTGSQYCLVEYNNVAGSSTYDFATFWLVSWRVNLVEADQFVGLVSQRWSGADNDLVVCALDKFNVVASYGGAFMYPNGLGVMEIGTWSVATAMGKDSIAVAYMYEDVLSGGGVYTRIRTIDLITMIMDNSMEINEQNKTAPVTITYIPSNGMLAVLHEEDLTLNSARCTYVDPWTSGYTTADYVYIQDEMFYSMDIHDGKYLILGGSGPRWWMIDATASLPLNSSPFMGSGPCPDNGYIDVDITPTFPDVSFNINWNVSSNIVMNSNVWRQGVSNPSIDIDCVIL